LLKFWQWAVSRFLGFGQDMRMNASIEVADEKANLLGITNVIPGEKYWVQCKGFRILAMADKDGTWRSFFTGKELPDVVGVVRRV